MSAWKKQKMGDIALLKWGDTSTTKSEYKDSGYRAYSASGPDGYMDHFDFDREGIVLSAIGANCGETWFTTGKWSAIKNTIVFWGLDRIANTRFLFYKTRGKKFWPQRGAAQPFISQTDARNIIVEIPDFSTQTHIASVLSAYDDLIENNEKRIKMLEEMAQLLYTEWFVKLKFPGYEKVNMVESGTDFGKIPEGWGVKRLGDVAKEVRESVDPNEIDPNTVYVGLEHIPRKTIILSEWGRVADVGSTKLKFKIGDILFGKIRPYFHKVVTAPVSGVASSDTVIIRAHSPSLQALVLPCVSGENFVAYATSSSQGTKMPRADWKNMSKYPILFPDAETLELFSWRTSSVVALMNSLMFQNRCLSMSRDFLIPRLVTGKRDLKTKTA